jgi:hypothetical protein
MTKGLISLRTSADSRVARRRSRPGAEGPKRYCRPRRMTPKAYNKRLRMAHMRRRSKRGPGNICPEAANLLDIRKGVADDLITT